MAQDSTPHDLNKIEGQEIFELSREQAQLIDNIETQVWYVREPHRFGLVNKASAEFFGVDKKSLNGKSIDSILSEEETQLLIKGNREVFENKKRTFSEIWIKNKEQEVRRLSIVRMPKLDQKGNVEYIICLVQDFTNNNNNNSINLQQVQQDTARILLNNTIDEIMLIDIDGIIIDINEKAAKNARKNIDEMIGNSIYNFMPSDLADYIDIQKEEAIRSGKIIIFDIDISGTHLEISLHPIMNNQGLVDRIAIFTHDITTRKLSENLLKESKEKFKIAFEKSEFYKNLFLHDFGNILNVINMSMELYLDKQCTLKENLLLTRKAIERGKKLMSNVIKLSQVDNVDIELEKIDVGLFIDEVIEFILESNPSRKITIDVDIPNEKLFAKANHLLSDVFENLLNNAIKYNNNEIIEILIKVSKEKKNDINYLKVEFQDNGFGITDEKKKQIFNRTTKKPKIGKGMGIGLSLVNEVIKSYKGKIWVENRIKNNHLKGSNFILLIPEF
ncbi:MAG: ATP-binding protein [Promethearchaeota archaeon]